MTLPFDPTQYIDIKPHELVDSSSMESALHRLVSAVSYMTEFVPNTDETRKAVRISSIHAFKFKAKLYGHTLVLVLSHNDTIHWKFDINLKVIERARYSENELAAKSVIYEAFDSLFTAFYLAEQQLQVSRITANIASVKERTIKGAVSDAVNRKIAEWVEV